MSTPIGSAAGEESNTDRFTTAGGGLSPQTDRFPATSYDSPPVVREETVSYVNPAPTIGRTYGQSATDLGIDRESVVAREKEQFGGIKIGSAFFGWVAAA